jgi:lipid II:glycine glycyltransferase (peptidoglycan interpeptide bridge formation enzyme)
MSPNSVHIFNPLEDNRWPAFIQSHPNASIFHTQGWLNSLKATYQYEPIAFTTSAPGTDLRNAIVFCKVQSWLTGRRLVSLPFSDHCEPLVEEQDEFKELLLHIEDFRKHDDWKYVELRPVLSRPFAQSAFKDTETYLLHQLDLRPNIDELLHSFHKDCVQRKIRKAEREGLEYEAGQNESQLQKLYGLLKLTRRRHNVPPQPIEWFRNLLSFTGVSARIHIASKDGLPAAGILTLSHGRKVVYKYGGSNVRMNNLGGMPLLFWKSIQEAKLAGADEFDFGRSDTDNPGLIGFKEHWATRRLTLTYWRCQENRPAAATSMWKTNLPKRTFASLPAVMQACIGRHLYRHIG